jgi:hypothetical protein
MWQSWHCRRSRAAALSFHSSYVFSSSFPFSAKPSEENWWQLVAERRLQEDGRPRHTTMGKGLPWHGDLRRPRAARRAEPLVVSHVAHGAREARSVQARVELGIWHEATAALDVWLLLGQGRVAGQAGPE